MGDERWDEDEVERPLANDLVGDRDVPAAGVSRLGMHQRQSCAARRQPHHRLRERAFAKRELCPSFCPPQLIRAERELHALSTTISEFASWSRKENRSGTVPSPPISSASTSTPFAFSSS